MTKKIIVYSLSLMTSLAALAQDAIVSSPDGRLVVTINSNNGKANYSVTYDKKEMLKPSELGLRTDIGDFYNNLVFKKKTECKIDENYTMRGTKASSKHYVANQVNLEYENNNKQPIIVTFNVSDNDIAFKYSLPQTSNTAAIIVNSEQSSFNLPERTTTFICPQSKAMVGWERTKPSYEEEYTPDAPINQKSQFGEGYTFPCLFKVGSDGWVLISETGSAGNYVGTHLSDYNPQKGYTIAFPMAGEANGFGTTTAGMLLPGSTPWRTITVGNSLKPIVETTIPYDVVKPQYTASENYKPGRYTWSWLIWQDNSVKYEDQIKFIDLASAMGYEYVLVDGLWDKQIGKEKIEQLSKYAQSKGTHLMLWYNSNGYENDAPQGPKNRMNSSVNRKKEMAWMKSIGVKGIKVDFFGGDKQHTMQLYEDILSDANDYGIQVIFHGCTLPRGWERMYPNYIASEAVLASENVFFSEYHAKKEAFELTMHPFCRNTVAAMDWGGVIMNKNLSKDNKSRHKRYTTNVFEMAFAIVGQSSVNCIAIQPNNLQELSETELNWLKEVPTTWDETRFVEGYPGKLAILARRHGDNWYVGGINAESTTKRIQINLPMFAGKTVKLYRDIKNNKTGEYETKLANVKVDKKGKIKIEIPSNGGIIIQDK